MAQTEEGMQFQDVMRDGRAIADALTFFGNRIPVSLVRGGLPGGLGTWGTKSPASVYRG